MDIIYKVLYLVGITIALGLFGLILQFIDEQVKKLQNNKLKGALESAMFFVEKAVKMVAQTYVGELKATDQWGTAEQKEAFEKAKEAALKTMDEETKVLLEDHYDVDALMGLLIESSVRERYDWEQ